MSDFLLHNNLCEFTTHTNEFKRLSCTEKLALKVVVIANINSHNICFENHEDKYLMAKFYPHTTQIFSLSYIISILNLSLICVLSIH